MYISKFELRNYKSYYEPNAIELGPRFNIITGQNNAGKTALLNALTLNFTGDPIEARELCLASVHPSNHFRSRVFRLRQLQRKFSEFCKDLPPIVGSSRTPPLAIHLRKAFHGAKAIRRKSSNY